MSKKNNSPMHRTCSFCGSLATTIKICGQCRIKGYCDKECQKQDWKKHKEVCGKTSGNRDIIKGVSESISEMSLDWKKFIKQVNDKQSIPLFVIEMESFKSTLIQLKFQAITLEKINKMHPSLNTGIFECAMETPNMIVCGIVHNESMRIVCDVIEDVGFVAITNK